MKKQVSRAALCLMFVWTLVSAQEWRSVGPSAKLYDVYYNSLAVMVQSTSILPYNELIVQDSTVYIGNGMGRLYYGCDLKGKTEWTRFLIRGFGIPTFDLPFQRIYANDSAWYSMPRGSDFPYRIRKDNDSSFSSQMMGVGSMGAYLGCGLQALLAVNGHALAAGLSGWCNPAGATCITQYFGISLSQDNASTWTTLTSNKVCTVQMYSLIISRKYVISSTSNGLLVIDRSTLNSRTIATSRPFVRLYECGNSVFGADSARGNHLYRSTDSCETWNSCKDGLPDSISISNLCSLGKEMFLASSNGGAFKYDTVKNSWLPCNAGLQETNIVDIREYNGSLLALSGNDLYEYSPSTHGRTARPAALHGKVSLAGFHKVYLKESGHICIRDNGEGLYDLSGRKLAGPVLRSMLKRE